jgi:hypothetical protein
MGFGGATTELVEIELPDGRVMWARVESPAGPRDVGIGSKVSKVSQVLGFTEALEWVGTNLTTGLGHLRPDHVIAEFGIELAFGQGGLVAALGGISGKGTVKVTLSWGGELPAPVAEAAPASDSD